MRLLNLVGLAWLVMLTGCEPFLPEETTALPKRQEASSFFYPLEGEAPAGEDKEAYVPVYSNIFISGGGRLNLAVTLSVRNTDFSHPITISSVRYYNTAGEMIEDYLDVPHVLAPMASTYFFVNQTDTRGGAGANFIVKWSGDPSANLPVIDAVMAGVNGTQGYSFITQGKLIENNKPLSEESTD